MRKGTITFLNIAVPLFAGLIIYVWLRPDTYVIGIVDGLLGIERDNGLVTPSGMQRVVQYYACDVLWAYSLTWAVASFIGAENWKKAFVISTMFCAAIECSQLIPDLPGSFDITDILIEITACFMAIMIIHALYKEEVYEKSN